MPHSKLETVGNSYGLFSMVRAWGFEPQRITAQEPKGDVTLGKDY